MNFTSVLILLPSSQNSIFLDVLHIHIWFIRVSASKTGTTTFSKLRTSFSAFYIPFSVFQNNVLNKKSMHYPRIELSIFGVVSIALTTASRPRERRRIVLFLHTIEGCHVINPTNQMWTFVVTFHQCMFSMYNTIRGSLTITDHMINDCVFQLRCFSVYMFIIDSEQKSSIRNRI
jgi:hypothetical protein